MDRQKQKTIEMVIPSSLERIEEVERMAEEAADRMRFNEEDKDSLAIAVTEAVNNAIIHGNKRDAAKKVVIRFVFQENGLLVSVKDEGEGFDPGQLSDPLAPENLLKESGRGIFILSSLMDDVTFHFEGGGTEIRMLKKKG